MQEIKIRKPKRHFCVLFNKNYTEKFNLWVNSFPKNGDSIRITWFPNNRGKPNAYIGFEGIVEDVCIDGFVINSGNSIIIVNSEDFDYIKV